MALPKKWYAFPLVTLFLFVGCSKEPTQETQLPPPLVSIMEVTKKNVPITASYMGQTMGYLSVEVRAQVPGILKKRLYKEGDYVNQGQLLFEIDPATAEAALEQAKARLAQSDAQYSNAKRELDRIIPLYQRNAVSQRDRDQAQAAFDSAKATMESSQAAVREAEIQLSYTKVTAPISGYTSSQTRNEGNLITLDPQGSLLTTINQTDPMYVAFAISSSEVMLLRRMSIEGRAEEMREGAPVSLTLIDGGVYPWKGVISVIDTQIDPYTSTLRVRAEFPNPQGTLLPGQFATVSVGGATLLNAVLIPQKSVLQSAMGPMVYVVDAENKANLTPIKFSDTFGAYFYVEDGVKPGDKIVVDGVNKIVPGQVVNPQLLPPVEHEQPLPTPDSIDIPNSPNQDVIPSPVVPDTQTPTQTPASNS